MRIPKGRSRPPYGHSTRQSGHRAAGPFALGLLGAAALAVSAAYGESAGPPPHLEDRGEGIPTSQFGTYVGDGQFLVYPFYEYTTNNEAEYKPSELGFPGEDDFFGEQTEHEALIFLSYGISDRLAFEFESALWASSELRKDPNDPSGVPERIKESGLGDVESQLRWLWTKETAARPMLYSFWEVVFPLQKDNVILGTQDWETALGFGAVRGFRWGTLNGRVSIKYDAEDGQVEPGEYAIEYLKRTSPKRRWVATLEGEDDEVSLIGEAQLTLSPRAVLKLNCGFGLTKKAPDFAPEVGVIFTF
jgi:hypothetical protein